MFMKNYFLLNVLSNESFDEGKDYCTASEYFQYSCDYYSNFQKYTPAEYVFLYVDRFPEELAYFELDKGMQDDIVH